MPAYDDNCYILNSLINVVKNLNFNCQLIIKPHPIIDIKTFFKNFKFFDINYEITNKHIKDLLVDANVVISGLSSVIFESLCLKIPTIMIDQENAIRFIPIPEYYKDYYYEDLFYFADDKKKLEIKLIEFIEKDDKKINQENTNSQLSNYFERSTQEKVEKFFMNLNYFKNKKIFITGHTGFKGSWLMAIMHYLGAKIYCVSNEIPTNPSHYKILDLKITKDLRSDITDFDKIYKIISEIQPDFLFHLAAKPIVLDSIMNPYITFKTNTLGTINILETIRKLKKAPVSVIITSDKSYKNVEQKKGYKETDILGGDDPYSSSKASAEIAIQSYFNTYLKNKNKLIAVGRAGNVVGGGDWANHRIVVDTVKSWSINKPTILRNPHSTRPWQHVLDPLFGYIALLLSLSQIARL